jgi:hypothetical protein
MKIMGISWVIQRIRLFTVCDYFDVRIGTFYGIVELEIISR